MFLTWATSRATLDLILKIPVPLWGCRGSSRLSGGKPWWSLTQSLDLWMSINSNQSNSNSAKFTAKLNPRQGDEKTMLEMLECALDASFITRPSGRWFSLTKISRNRVWMSWTEGETWGDATPFCSWFGLELLSSSTTRYKKIADSIILASKSKGFGNIEPEKRGTIARPARDQDAPVRSEGPLDARAIVQQTVI